MVCIACFAYPLIVLVLMPMLEWLGKLVERWTGVKVAAEQPDDDETSTEANEEQAEAEMRDIDGSLGENEGREPEVVAASG